MKDIQDKHTLDFIDGKRKRGRPASPSAKSGAERTRAWRAAQAARLSALSDPTQPVRSKLIDLSALPPWKRA